ADAGVLLRGVGADEGEAPVGVLGAGGPDLLAVDQEVVALVLGAGRKAGQVRAGAGFGEALAPPDLAGDDAGDVALLLLFGPVFQERRAEHHDAHAADRVVGAGSGQFLDDDLRSGGVESAAAVLGRPGRHAPALLAHDLLPGEARRIGLRLVEGARAGGLALQRRREVLRDPVARLLAKGHEVDIGLRFHRVPLTGFTPRRFLH